MPGQGAERIIEEFRHFIGDDAYPCVAARAALKREQIQCFVAGHLGCPNDDHAILSFIYNFVDVYRNSAAELHSAAVIFTQPESVSESLFDLLLWKRLQALSEMDAKKYAYDKRVDDDPMAPGFSFSLGEEAFFIIGLHPGSSREARRFKYPALVFNPHAQFEELRKQHRYEKMKKIVRKRDLLYSGSINPMLADYGDASEVFQYSGRQYGSDWACPLKVMHGTTKHNSTEK